MAPVATPTSSPSYQFKEGPGVIHSFSATTTDTTAWLMIFDATAVPANGTVTPKYSYAINGGSIALNFEPNPAIFTNGFCACVSTTGPFSKTLSSATVHMVAQFS